MPELHSQNDDAFQIGAEHHRAGRVAEADASYRQGLAHYGALSDAIVHFKQMTTLCADDMRKWFALGIALRMNKNWGEAVAAFKRAIGVDNTFGGAYVELAGILKSLGRADEAFEIWNRAVEIQPDSAIAYSELAFALIDRGKLDEAELACRKAIEINPKMPGFYVNLGNILSRKSLPSAAQSAYLEAIHCVPDSATAYHSRGLLLCEMKAFDEALADHRRALELSPNDIALHLAIIQTHLAKGDVVEGERYCRQALLLDSESPEVWECLGRLLQMVGRFDEAADCFRRSLEIYPNGITSLLLARLGRQTQSSDERKIISLLNRPELPLQERVAAGFARGEILDKADRYDEAFAAYSEANALFKEFSARQNQYFDGDDLHLKVDQMIQSCTAEYFQTRLDLGQKSELPVFIVGMPRSGTTLVEQIAASHSQVFGMGELPEIGFIRARLAAMEIEKSPHHWQRHWHRHLGKVHLAKLAMQAGNATRVIDKMPANVFHLGLIATLFPQARVIFCRRNPQATCLSCFFQMFENNNLMFSYDLKDCARQYIEVDRLASHWNRVLPLQMLTVQYEELVENLETQSRRIIDFLGLDWEPNCLDFHKGNRPVLTRSVWQVRQPIYNRAVERWKCYQKHLGPLQTALALGGLRDN